MSLPPVVLVINRIISFAMIALSVGISAWGVLTHYDERHLLRTRIRVARQVEKPVGKGVGREAFGWLLPAATVARMKAAFEERRLVSGLPLSWASFVSICGAFGLLFLTSGLFYFHNVLAGIALAAVGVLLPDQVLSTGASVHQDKTHEQLQVAIHTFSTEYRTHRTVQRAFLETAKQLPEPIRLHFDRAAKRLNNGEDSAAVLEELALRLKHPFAQHFVNNCLAVMKNQQAKNLFDDIAYQLNQWRVRQKANRAALSGGRTVGLIVNASMIPAYLIMERVQPQTHDFFTGVALGRGLLVLMVVGVLLTFGVNKYLAATDW